MKSEEQTMKEQQNSVDFISAILDFPYFVLQREMKTGYSLYTKELIDIKKDYEAYKKGALFNTEGTSGSYIASNLRFKNIKILVDKEARYMFSQSPEFKIKAKELDEKHTSQAELYQTIIDIVLKKSKFAKKLLQSAKDCFVGKRVACLVDFSENKGVQIHFYNSLQFYYETDYDSEDLTKFVSFKNVTKAKQKTERRYLVNRYESINNNIYITSILYDGVGNVIETLIPETKTELKEIPACIIVNDGTLEDETGVSEVAELLDYESTYSFIGNSGIDSTRKAMNPIRYTVDMDEGTTDNLSSGAGAYWDLRTNQNQNEVHPMVGTLAPSMNHTEPVKAELDMIKTTMYNQVDIPNISEETMAGTITSGKTIEALYFPLTVRCDEKMKTWIPALEFIARTIIDFVVMNADLCEELYQVQNIGQIVYDVEIKEHYALLKDTEEEKRIDMEEIAVNARSRKSYLNKWRKQEFAQEEHIDEELMQIATEINMFDTMSMNTQVQNNLEEEEVDETIEDETQTIEAQKE